MTSPIATDEQAPFDRLVAREVERVREELERAHPRTLADNPEGNALVTAALRDALLLGLEAGCRRAGTPMAGLDYSDPEAWERWQAERARSPEGLGWPTELEAIAPDTVAQAGQLVADAAAELGLRRRALRRFADAGVALAHAGAALARALTAPSPLPETPAPAKVAELGAPEPDGSVRVAVAANQAEAEFLESVLAAAEIPSTWRRTGGDLPELLAAGYREIYVPAAAADEAQALLATLEESPPDEDEPEPTRRIGLERTGLRLIGKWGAALVVASFLAGTVLGLVTQSAALGALLFLSVLLAAGAAVLWSERAGNA